MVALLTLSPQLATLARAVVNLPRETWTPTVLSVLDRRLAICWFE
jgi:hypothetical protein